MTCRRHTNADGLSMTELIHIFNCVPQRMTEVEQSPVALLKFICLHYRRFDLYISFDQLCQGSFILLIRSLLVLFQLAKKFRVFDATMFDDLGKSIDPFLLRKRF